MRNSSVRVKLVAWKKAYWCILLLVGFLALMLSLATLSIFYSRSHFPVTDGLCGRISIGQGKTGNEWAQTAASLIRRIEDEMESIRGLSQSEATDEENQALKNERVRHVAFLADILGLLKPMKTELQVGGDEDREKQSGIDHGAIDQVSGGSSIFRTDAMADFFLIEELRKYINVKPNRLGKQNFLGANGTFTSIGHGCFSMKPELEQYMDYDVGDICGDDWKLAQRLMVQGCDPLPRRRCFSRAPKLYNKPFPINESLWKLPDDRNVRWSQYRCKNFACLASNGTKKGFFKCSDCFNLTHHEKPRWMKPTIPDPATNLSGDFLIEDVLRIKPGEIRIGLDFSSGTGTFAARMKEFNVTIVSATINLGAPFSEMIALRGLVPLYLTINQRLPFFDNTLDIIHTTRFLDGWIDFALLDFVLYDWDRVLRPGGLLWIDSFFCSQRDMDDYLEAFKMPRYKKHKWVVVPKLDKDGEEFFFSAILEKPPRPF